MDATVTGESPSPSGQRPTDEPDTGRNGKPAHQLRRRWLHSGEGQAATTTRRGKHEAPALQDGDEGQAGTETGSQRGARPRPLAGKPA